MLLLKAGSIDEICMENRRNKKSKVPLREKCTGTIFTMTVAWLRWRDRLHARKDN